MTLPICVGLFVSLTDLALSVFSEYIDFLFCFGAFDCLTTICHLAIVNVCVIIILSMGNTQMSILLLCFLYLFVELKITINEYILFKPVQCLNIILLLF